MYDQHMINFHADRFISRHPGMLGRALRYAVETVRQVRELQSRAYLRPTGRRLLADIQREYI